MLHQNQYSETFSDLKCVISGGLQIGKHVVGVRRWDKELLDVFRDRIHEREMVTPDKFPDPFVRSAPPDGEGVKTAAFSRRLWDEHGICKEIRKAKTVILYSPSSCDCHISA